LHKHAIEGFNDIGMMPAKGLCMSCSDDEVMAAVDYMLENSK
jgi:cytochrome c5